MTHSAEDIEKFHHALRRFCGLERLPFTFSDSTAWQGFLFVMQPLEGSEGGPFTLSDLTAVLSEIRQQKNRGINWTLRPTAILREPERFRDMVEEARRSLRIVKRVAERPASSPAVQSLPTGTRRLTEDPEPQPESTPAGEAAWETWQEMKRNAGLTSP